MLAHPSMHMCVLGVSLSNRTAATADALRPVSKQQEGGHSGSAQQLSPGKRGMQNQQVMELCLDTGAVYEHQSRQAP